MAELKTWGVRWNPGMYHADYFACKCTSDWPDLDRHIELLVGFDMAGGPQKKGDPGIGVFKCDKCFEFYWFHLGKPTAEYFADFAPQWSK